MTNSEARRILNRELDDTLKNVNGVRCPICNEKINSGDHMDTLVYAKSKRDKQHRFYHKVCVENQWKSGDHR